MCKEDIRLARLARSGRTATATPAGATATKLLPANPQRFALVAGVNVPLPGAGVISGMVYALVGGNRAPLITFTGDHTGGFVSLLDVGQLITEEIWYISDGSTNITQVWVAESQFLEPLEQL